MALKFPTLIVASSSASSATVDVLVEASAADITAIQEGVDYVMRVFVEAGRLGGFPFPVVEPSQSRLALLATAVQNQQLQYRLETSRVAPQAFQVLRNMAARLQIADPPVSRIMTCRTVTRYDTAAVTPRRRYRD